MTALAEADRQALAARILEAMRSGVPIDPPSDTVTYGWRDARAIQDLVVAALVAGGGTLRGHKIGFTSEVMQRMYGIDEPDYGRLFDDMLVADGGDIAAGSLCDPRVEPEVSFVIARRLEGPGVGVDDVLAATAHVQASIEVIASRVGSLRARGVDSIADNAGAGKFVLGSVTLPPDAVDLPSLPVTLDVDGAISTGVGSAALGHPAASVAWLANKLASFGEAIEAGSVVMSGSVTGSVPVHAGSLVAADFGPLGSVRARFV